MDNKSKKNWKKMILFWAKVLILVVQVGMYAFVWYHYYKDLMPTQYWHRGNWAIILIYAFLLTIVNKAFGSLKIGYHKTWDVMFNQILTIICVNFVTYMQLLLINGDWAMFRHLVPYFEHFSPIVYLSLAEFLVVFVWALASRWLYAKVYPPHEMLLIHNGMDIWSLKNKIAKRSDKYRICEIHLLSEGIEPLKQLILQSESVLLGEMPVSERNLLMEFCFEHSIRCYGIPNVADIMIRSADDINLFDSPFFLYRNSSMNHLDAFVKRLMDIVFSVLALIFLFIPMGVIAACIHFYDGGPVLYTQKRLTRGGEIFDIYKFRSMAVNSEGHEARLAQSEDSRITPVGRVIRRLHFDELPQLFNIIKGEMSLVGPRPERPEIAEEYKKSIPQFDFRLKVKAGLTGYAQVYGQYNTNPIDKLKMDLIYIEQYSVWLDIKLMALTVKILFWKEKSEGVASGQKTALGGRENAKTEPGEAETSEEADRNAAEVSEEAGAPAAEAPEKAQETEAKADSGESERISAAKGQDGRKDPSAPEKPDGTKDLRRPAAARRMKDGKTLTRRYEKHRNRKDA